MQVSRRSRVRALPPARTSSPAKSARSSTTPMPAGRRSSSSQPARPRGTRVQTVRSARVPTAVLPNPNRNHQLDAQRAAHPGCSPARKRPLGLHRDARLEAYLRTQLRDPTCQRPKATGIKSAGRRSKCSAHEIPRRANTDKRTPPDVPSRGALPGKAASAAAIRAAPARNTAAVVNP